MYPQGSTTPLLSQSRSGGWSQTLNISKSAVDLDKLARGASMNGGFSSANIAAEVKVRWMHCVYQCILSKTVRQLAFQAPRPILDPSLPCAYALESMVCWTVANGKPSNAKHVPPSRSFMTLAELPLSTKAFVLRT